MELHVQAAGVAHRLALRVAPPQRGGGRVAVGAAEAGPAGGGLRRGRPVRPAAGPRLWLLGEAQREEGMAVDSD